MNYLLHTKTIYKSKEIIYIDVTKGDKILLRWTEIKLVKHF